MSRIKVDDLFSEINREIDGYASEVADGIKEDVKGVAKECLKQVREHSPRRYGRYRKGWRVKKSFEDERSIRMTIYNATDYQLIHLLESGHQMPGGGRFEGKPHVGPAEQAAATELRRRVVITVGKNK